MNVDEHLSHLDDAGKRLGAAASAAGLDAHVPSCPEWVVRDLVRHQGGIHRWATGYVTGPRTEIWDVDLPDAPGRRRTRRRLAADMVPTAFAADGIDELLTCFITRPSGKLRTDPPRTLAVRCTDDAGAWLVSIGPDRVTTSTGSTGEGAAADCQISGSANDLYLALWHRLPVAGPHIEGDVGVFDLFSDKVRVTWRGLSESGRGKLSSAGRAAPLRRDGCRLRSPVRV